LARRAALALALLTAAAGAAHSGEALRNGFDDPFFQLSHALADCPLPAGPFITEAERRVQSHHRAEKGTTCWLAGECAQPNAYAYDREIAAAIRAAVRGQRALAASTLWVTVQGRIVYIEGCAARASAAADLEALARRVPHVQQAIAAIRTDPRERAPYRVRGAR
ncbi:MAG TPA: BON domain-containing protein, partial [Burkholderiaceae bacterium]|nr:BON domain-containing protein [Burkholderiaceae bacterium]